MENKDTGILLSKKDISLHRKWFKEFVKLRGINVQYEEPNPNFDKYDLHGETDIKKYLPPITVGCIYDSHPDQKSMKKMGWVAELADSSVMIHVPYDTPGIQAGAIFTIPSGLDDAPPRKFKVLRLQNSAIYPSSISCELGPLLDDRDEKATVRDFRNSNFNLLADDDEDEED